MDINRKIHIHKQTTNTARPHHLIRLKLYKEAMRDFKNMCAEDKAKHHSTPTTPIGEEALLSHMISTIRNLTRHPKTNPLAGPAWYATTPPPKSGINTFETTTAQPDYEN